jgi:hypothetical protein
VHEGAPLRRGPEDGLHAEPEARQLRLGAVADLVVPERRVQGTTARELGELDGGHGPAPTGLLPELGYVHDLAGRGHVVHASELDPLDVPDDRDSHARGSLSGSG